MELVSTTGTFTRLRRKSGPRGPLFLFSSIFSIGTNPIGGSARSRAVRMEMRDLVLARPVSAVTPALSSLTGLLRTYFSNLFPTDYIKEYFVSTELSARGGYALRGRFRPLTLSNVSQRRYPLLSIRIDPTSDVSDYATGTAWWQGNRFLLRPENLTLLILDDIQHRVAGYMKDRIVCRFQLTVVCQSELQAYEVLSYLKRVAPINIKVFLSSVAIANELPGDVLRAIWGGMGLGDGSNPADWTTFGEYLQTVTAGGIECTVSSATGRRAYSFFYSANPILNITSSPTASVNREGGVVRTAQVELSAELDVTVPLAYSFRQEPSLVMAPGRTPDFGAQGDRAYFGLTYQLRPPANIPGGLSLAYCVGMVAGEQDPVHPSASDTTDFSPYIPEPIKAHITRLLAQSGGSALVQTQLFRLGEPIALPLFSFDYANWTLTIQRGGLFYTDKYYVLIYCDLSTFERDYVPLHPQTAQPQSPYFGAALQSNPSTGDLEIGETTLQSSPSAGVLTLGDTARWSRPPAGNLRIRGGLIEPRHHSHQFDLPDTGFSFPSGGQDG
jgi:hypothetical protein